jgi:hypothetical protein
MQIPDGTVVGAHTNVVGAATDVIDPRTDLMRAASDAGEEPTVTLLAGDAFLTPKPAGDLRSVA